MKDKLILPDIAFQAKGKCKLQYTDPDTGKVLMEVGGDNHVFIKQFVGTTGFQASALASDLFLCQGGHDPGDDIPVIPGDPIGYGRVGTDGAGLYRGTYRTADSYYNKRSLAKVSNKYVYDFLNTQALGRVDWVGLTAALSTGYTNCAWRPPFPYNLDNLGNTVRVYNCETGEYHYLSPSGTTLYLKHTNRFTDTSERSLSLYSALGAFYSGYRKVCLDTVNNRVYVLAYYKQSSSGSYLSKCLLLSEDLSSVESVTDIASGGSGIQYGEGGCAYNGKIGWVYRYGVTSYRVYTLDLSTMAITSAIKYNTGSENYIKIDNDNTMVYRRFVWNDRASASEGSAAGEGSYFLYTSPLVDVELGEAVAMIPPGPRPQYSPWQYMTGLACVSAYAGQWVSYQHTDSAPQIVTAYTKYRVPEDTPDRPEGTGMTVTYELEIEW